MKAKPSYNRTSSQLVPKTLRTLPSGIWALGFVSMFMDISSELIYSLLPVFMASVLGASMTTIGLVEGAAEAAAAFTKIFSGAVSDYLGKRKLLAGLGYGLATLTKPIFPLATSISWVFAARFTDRIGKGIRGAPRDALVADISPAELWGAAYGLRQALDSIGALIGPLAALALMALLANNIRAVLWTAVAPALLAVALLFFGVHDPKRAKSSSGHLNPVRFTHAIRMPRRYWFVVGLGALFTLARFSEAFLVLRAQSVGLPTGYIPMVLIVMNFFYAVSAYPAGIAADRHRQRTLLFTGLLMLVAADLLLAAAASPLLALTGAAFWGMHLGLTQGLFAKLVADPTPPGLRGTAFGIFNLISGGSLLLASVVAGALWSAFGAPATFLTGAAFAMLTMIGLLAYPRKALPVRG